MNDTVAHIVFYGTTGSSGTGTGGTPVTKGLETVTGTGETTTFTHAIEYWVNILYRNGLSTVKGIGWVKESTYVVRWLDGSGGALDVSGELVSLEYTIV
jgi:hypothetical protein